MKLKEYVKEASRTSRINWAAKDGSNIAALSILGCIGSLALIVRKKYRDGDKFLTFKDEIEDKIGDCLWYIVAISDQINISLGDWPKTPTQDVEVLDLVFELNNLSQEIVSKRKELTTVESIELDTWSFLIHSFIEKIITLTTMVGSDIGLVASQNVFKNLQYWCQFDDVPAAKFDQNLPLYEQLPRRLALDFVKVNEKSLLIMLNGVAVGDRLTDNFSIDDGYRYHDDVVN